MESSLPESWQPVLINADFISHNISAAEMLLDLTLYWFCWIIHETFSQPFCGFHRMTHLTTIVLLHFNLSAVKSISLVFFSFFFFQPVHLAQSCFQVEAFGRTFTLDLELNQLVLPCKFIRSDFSFLFFFFAHFVSVGALNLLQLF